MHEIMKQLISEAVTFAESLLAEEPKKPNNIEYPMDKGVYFIRCDEKPRRGIIYVGKTSNLKRELKIIFRLAQEMMVLPLSEKK